MQAAPPPDPPATIVVTARALPDPAAERAFSVTRIDSGRLRNSPSSQLDEVLKQVPGLQLFRRSDARSAHPTSQGVTLRALGGNASSRALLVLDGVPQADPFGGWVNWPAYDPASLGDVRVIRGGGSVSAGPGALAGVIEMTSRADPGFSAGADAGSRRSIEGRLIGGVKLGGGQALLSARAARGDGFVPVTAAGRGPVDRAAPYDSASVRGRWSAPLAAQADVQLGLLAFTDGRDRGVPFTANRTDGTDASLRLLGRGGAQWSLLAYGQWRELESSFATVNSDRSAASRVSLQDSVPSNALGGSFEVRPGIGPVELRLGGDIRSASGESRELYSFVAGEPTRRRTAGGTTLAGGLFAEAALPLDRLTVTLGARVDRWRISGGELLERMIATGEPLRTETYPARSGWRPTARAGLVHDLGAGFGLRSAAYLGWRMPTLNELFRPFRAGADATAANPRLEPERLAGIEAGALYEGGPVRLSATFFANRLTGAITNVTLGRGPGVFPGVGFVGAGGEYRQRQNLDSMVVAGGEASVEWRRGVIAAGAGLSLTRARMRADGPAAPLDGLRPPQTPRIALTGSLAWDSGGRSLSLVARHVGRQFEDDLNQRALPAATTLDAFGMLPLGRRLRLVARAENLLDETIVAGIGANGIAERATPRTLWIGLRLEPK